FGIAKVKEGTDSGGMMTQAGTIMGSPYYMSPEHINSRSVDERADIYSLGCLMFRMLSGNVPFKASTAIAVCKMHLEEPIPAVEASGLPASVVELVEQCLAKEPALRPASMAVVLDRLENDSRSAPSAPTDVVKERKLKPSVRIAISLAVLCL